MVGGGRVGKGEKENVDHADSDLVRSHGRCCCCEAASSPLFPFSFSAIAEMRVLACVQQAPSLYRKRRERERQTENAEKQSHFCLKRRTSHSVKKSINFNQSKTITDYSINCMDEN